MEKAKPVSPKQWLSQWPDDSLQGSGLCLLFSLIDQSWNPMDCSMSGFPGSLSPTPRAYSNSCPSSQWSYPTISFSVVPFSSCLQSFPASGSFQMSQFFSSGAQSIRVSASALVLLMNIQDWFPSGWTGWISLQSKGLSRVFSSTIQKHPFFSTQPSSWSALTSIHDSWINRSFD